MRFTRNVLLLLLYSLENILKTNKLERTKVLPEELPFFRLFYVLPLKS